MIPTIIHAPSSNASFFLRLANARANGELQSFEAAGLLATRALRPNPHLAPPPAAPLALKLLLNVAPQREPTPVKAPLVESVEAIVSSYPEDLTADQHDGFIPKIATAGSGEINSVSLVVDFSEVAVSFHSANSLDTHAAHSAEGIPVPVGAATSTLYTELGAPVQLDAAPLLDFPRTISPGLGASPPATVVVTPPAFDSSASSSNQSIFYCPSAPRIADIVTDARLLIPAVDQTLFISPRKLGRGGFGTVFEGKMKLEGEVVDVAVKEIERVTRNGQVDCSFTNEAVASAIVSDSPYIIQLLAASVDSTDDAGAAPHRLVYQMARGQDLAHHIWELKENYETFGAEALMRLAIRVGSAVATLHARGVAHSDIKPANILYLDEDRELAVLGDLGLASLIEDGRVPLAGTREYHPPEAFTKECERYGLDDTIDVWGLGCVLFECFTGHVFSEPSTPAESKTAQDGVAVGWLLQGDYTSRFADDAFSGKKGQKVADFLFNLLHADPAHRPRAQDVVFQAESLLAEFEADRRLAFMPSPIELSPHPLRSLSALPLSLPPRPTSSSEISQAPSPPPLLPLQLTEISADGLEVHSLQSSLESLPTSECLLQVAPVAHLVRVKVPSEHRASSTPRPSPSHPSLRPVNNGALPSRAKTQQRWTPPAALCCPLACVVTQVVVQGLLEGQEAQELAAPGQRGANTPHATGPARGPTTTAKPRPAPQKKVPPAPGWGLKMIAALGGLRFRV